MSEGSLLVDSATLPVMRLRTLFGYYKAHIEKDTARVERLGQELGCLRAELSRKVSKESERFRAQTEAMLYEADLSVERLKQELGNVSATLADTQKKLLHVEGMRDAVLSSTSWRLTGPVRRLVQRSSILHLTLLRARRAAGVLRRRILA